MAATRGPASLLPTWIQLRRPSSYRAHRVLGQVVAQFQLRIFQEATEPTPKRQRVIAGLGESALGQGTGPCCLDARVDFSEQRLAFSKRRT